MKKYKIEITETLQKQITVKSDSESEAMEKVLEMYKNEEIVLGAENFIDNNFEIVSE